MATAPIARLGSISLDCREPRPLADFWCALLGMQPAFEAPDGHFIAITDGRTFLSMVRAEDHEPPSWPEPGQLQQLHLDLGVEDLDAAQEAAVAVGARVADVQPNPQMWRVLLDPAGHPFCLTTGIPDPASLPR